MTKKRQKVLVYLDVPYKAFIDEHCGNNSRSEAVNQAFEMLFEMGLTKSLIERTVSKLKQKVK